MHSSAGSCTRPLNVGPRNPRGFTRLVQDSSTYTFKVSIETKALSALLIPRHLHSKVDVGGPY